MTNQGVKMTQAEALHQRDRVVDILTGMISDIYNEPTTPGSLRGLVAASETVTTKLKSLQAWAEPTEETVMEAHLRKYHRWDGLPRGGVK